MRVFNDAKPRAWITLAFAAAGFALTLFIFWPGCCSCWRSLRSGVVCWPYKDLNEMLKSRSAAGRPAALTPHQRQEALQRLANGNAQADASREIVACETLNARASIAIPKSTIHCAPMLK